MRILLPTLLLAGCWGRNIPYEGGPGGQDTEVIATTCGADIDRSVGFTAEGTTLDLSSNLPVTAGMCISAVDPTGALTGGEPEVLASSQVCDDGTYVIGNIPEPPSIGMFLVIDDCEGQPDTMMRTATGIKADVVADLGDGDTLEGVVALGVSLDWAAVEQTDLERVGWSGDLASSGYMAGIVEDSGSVAVAGATVGCNDCVPAIYYQDGDGADGIYGAASTPNTETTVEGDGLFIIPGAPIFTYSCTDGGAHEWESTLLGSLPGYAVYIRFTAS